MHLLFLIFSDLLKNEMKVGFSLEKKERRIRERKEKHGIEMTTTEREREGEVVATTTLNIFLMTELALPVAGWVPRH